MVSGRVHSGSVEGASVKLTPHVWVKLRGLPWPVCSCCGLVALRNERTRSAMQVGCEK